MSTYVRYPFIGGVPIYATASSLPASAITGSLAVTADSGFLYEFNGSSWVVIASSVAGSAIDALTGDVTATGPGSVPATIASNAVTNAKLAQMPAHTFKGNNTGSTANAIDLTKAQLTAELNQFTTTLQGVVPGSGGGSTNFLRADGTWTIPSGTGVSSIGTFDSQSASANGLVISGSALYAQSADATHPGMVNTTTQTMAGDKTFSASIASPLFSSTSGALASSGQIRLASTDAISWRNGGDSGNIYFTGSGTDDLQLVFPTAGAKFVLVDANGDGEVSATGRLTLAGGGGGVFVTSGDVLYLDGTTDGHFNAATLELSATAGAMNLSSTSNIISTPGNNFTVNAGNSIVLQAATDANITLQTAGTGVSRLITDNGTYVLISPGDLSEQSFSAANNQAAPADVTGFLFSNMIVRSFEAQVSVAIAATANLYESFKLYGIQRDADWQMSQTSVGDTSNIVFSITTGGQIQYTSGNEAGFTGNTIKFRAITTSV